MRRACSLLVAAMPCVLAPLAGCQNAWRANYMPEAGRLVAAWSGGSGAPASSSPADTSGGPLAEPLVRLVPAGEVLTYPPPPGLVRVGTCDFVTSATPSPQSLAAHARSLGAREVVWGREFVTATSGIDFRHETWPSTRTHVSTITRADGSVDRVTTTSTDWYTSSVPYSRTDAWYRYVAAFFADAGPTP
jgi:hypothetical protein